jgi:hypothetical protein
VRVRSAVAQDAAGWWVEVHEWERDDEGGPLGGMPIAPPNTVTRIGPFADGEAAHAFATGPLRNVLRRGSFDQHHFDRRTWRELEAAGIGTARKE